MRPHPLAEAQWQSEDGATRLIRLWQTSPAKREAEEIVGRLVRILGKHDSIIELGCGAGLIIPHLPKFKRYLGYDTSTYLLAEALDRFEADKRCRFDVRDMFDIPKYRLRRPVDVVICVHVARHYLDPVKVLRQAIHWPARGYVLSALHGPERRDLLNGICLATEELDAFLTEAGETVDFVEQPVGDAMMVRYVALRPRQVDGPKEAMRRRQR